MSWEGKKLLKKIVNCLFNFCWRASQASNSCTDELPPARAIMTFCTCASAKLDPWHPPTTVLQMKRVDI